MTKGNRYKTIRWRFVESLELPRVVHARAPDMVSKGNLYGQVTVRMHSRQVGPAKTTTVGPTVRVPSGLRWLKRLVLSTGSLCRRWLFMIALDGSCWALRSSPRMCWSTWFWRDTSSTPTAAGGYTGKSFRPGLLLKSQSLRWCSAPFTLLKTF